MQDQEFFKKILSLDGKYVVLEILETTFSNCFSANKNSFSEDLRNDIIVYDLSKNYNRRLEKILLKKWQDFS